MRREGGGYCGQCAGDQKKACPGLRHEEAHGDRRLFQGSTANNGCFIPANIIPVSFIHLCEGPLTKGLFSGQFRQKKGGSDTRFCVWRRESEVEQVSRPDWRLPGSLSQQREFITPVQYDEIYILVHSYPASFPHAGICR